jgi:GNAT superfamily N-acetyltransferase
LKLFLKEACILTPLGLLLRNLQMVESIRIECIDGSSPHLKAVMDLGKQHAETLGFFPKGAFQEHASRRHIFVALTSRNECAGYLLYRTSGNKAVIVHLCVNPTIRKQGVARKLVDKLKTETKHLVGIGLHCRRDYDVKGMWPRLGFAAVHSKPGRGSKPSQLTYWWFSHGHADLFSSIDHVDESKQRVVIDANVFFDLNDPIDIESEESKALLAPWLQDDFGLLRIDGRRIGSTMNQPAHDTNIR